MTELEKEALIALQNYYNLRYPNMTDVCRKVYHAYLAGFDRKLTQNEALIWYPENRRGDNAIKGAHSECMFDILSNRNANENEHFVRAPNEKRKQKVGIDYWLLTDIPKLVIRNVQVKSVTQWRLDKSNRIQFHYGWFQYDPNIIHYLAIMDRTLERSLMIQYNTLLAEWAGIEISPENGRKGIEQNLTKPRWYAELFELATDLDLRYWEF